LSVTVVASNAIIDRDYYQIIRLKSVFCFSIYSLLFLQTAVATLTSRNGSVAVISQTPQGLVRSTCQNYHKISPYPTGDGLFNTATVCSALTTHVGSSCVLILCLYAACSFSAGQSMFSCSLFIDKGLIHGIICCSCFKQLVIIHCHKSTLHHVPSAATAIVSLVDNEQA